MRIWHIKLYFNIRDVPQMFDLIRIAVEYLIFFAINFAPIDERRSDRRLDQN